MILLEPWDSEPDALILLVTACVVCGEYTEPNDLMGYAMWQSGSGAWTCSIPLAYHCRSDRHCSSIVDKAVSEDDGMLLDWHIATYVDALKHNVNHPPCPGANGLLRCHRAPLDLVRTHRLLERICSPLVAAL